MNWSAKVSGAAPLVSKLPRYENSLKCDYGIKIEENVYKYANCVKFLYTIKLQNIAIAFKMK